MLEDKVTLKQVFTEWVPKVHHPVVAVETGCSYLWLTEYLPFLSTPNLLDHVVAPTSGILYSLDNDGDHIKTCSDQVVERGSGEWIEYIFADSLAGLARLKSKRIQPNFIWLDSAEDSNHAMREFLAVQRMAYPPYVLCVDDYGNPNSLKWKGISDIIKLVSLDWKEYDTPTGLIVGLMQ